MANALRDQAKCAEAEDEYKRVIQLDEKVLGPHNHDTLDGYYNFAYQLVQLGRIDEAKEMAKRAADSPSTALGATHPNVRKYAAFLKLLEDRKPVTIPEVEFQKRFMHFAALPDSK